MTRLVFIMGINANFGKTVRLFRTSGALISLETVQKLLLDGLWYREKRGCPTAAGGRRESPSPESGLLSNGFAWS